MHGSVEAFTLPVPLRVVGRGAALLDPIQFTQLLHQDTLKVPPLVRVDPGRHPKTIKPLSDQDPCHRGRLLVTSRNCLGEL